MKTRAKNRVRISDTRSLWGSTVHNHWDITLRGDGTVYCAHAGAWLVKRGARWPHSPSLDLNKWIVKAALKLPENYEDLL